jgi:hypothetical protein
MDSDPAQTDATSPSTADAVAEPANGAAIDYGLGVVGALASGALGHFLFFVLVRQGFYALVLPGHCSALGAARRRVDTQSPWASAVPWQHCSWGYLSNGGSPRSLPQQLGVFLCTSPGS